MPVDWLDDARAFTSRDWSRLVDADPDATPFHTPRWLRCYTEELGAGRMRIAVVRHGDEDVAAAAFDLRGSVLTWLGGFDVTDYLGPVGLPAAREGAAKELVAAMCDRDDWREADLAGLPEDGAWLPALRGAAEAVGLRPQVALDDVAPFVDLPATFDGYLAALRPRHRHEIRRKERRFRERFPDGRLVDVGPDGLPAAMDRFLEMHRSSPGPKGGFMEPRMGGFFRRIADELLPGGGLRLTALEGGGAPLAMALGLRWRDRFFLYNSAFDPAYGEVSPGMVLVAGLIRTAVEDEGRRGLDMLKGDLGYKYRFGARPRRVVRLRWRREGP